MNLQYLSLRLVRHYMPESLARFLLQRRWIIKPGLETSDPNEATERYVATLVQMGRSIVGKRVLVFGYGGGLAIAVELLKRGAGHVVLSEHFVAMDDDRNRLLLPQHETYLELQGGRVMPRANFITLVHGDIRSTEIQSRIGEVDCVLSNSVYEHLDDVDGITKSLARLTREDGFDLHFIDLRDHYFKFPFEMLTFSQRVWKSYLNPSSNLNRLRLDNYRAAFEGCFDSVEIDVLERLEPEFLDVRARVRPEFISGDSAIDSVSLIKVFASGPHR